MSKNPLFPFFSRLFHTSSFFLQKNTVINIGDYQCKILENVISYQSKLPTKENPFRFAFVGEYRNGGQGGHIMGVNARITPKAVRFDKENDKPHCMKLFKPNLNPTESHRKREIELGFAFRAGQLNAKRTGLVSFNAYGSSNAYGSFTLYGMLMRDLGSVNFSDFLKQESYVLVKQTIKRRGRWDYVFNVIYLDNDKLFYLDIGKDTAVEIRPTDAAMEKAYEKLKQLINAFPKNNLRYFASGYARELIETVRSLPHGSLQAYSIEKRLQITINLFKALRDQLVTKGISHNDIKPENIMINPKTNEITIVDFGLSSELGAILPGPVGNPLYSSPEKIMMCNDIIKPESDRYSIAKTAAFLWGVDEDTFGSDISDLNRVNKNEQVLQTLFSRLDVLPSDFIQERIRQALQSLLYYDPERRAPLDQVIKTFEIILEDYVREVAEEYVVGGWRTTPC